MTGKELFVIDEKEPLELEPDKNEKKVYVKINNTSYFTMTQLGIMKTIDDLENCLKGFKGVGTY